jgi:amino acid transporter
VLIVWVLSYFDVKWSVWVMAPFALVEIGSLALLDVAITIHGGGAGNDLLHTFTLAGASLKGVAPGGVLGVGVALALAFFSYIGFESAGGYGEEARHPHRAIPLAIIVVAVLMSVLYIWTSYSATIGLGWTHAVDTLGNVALAPEPYYQLANTYVGGWLKVLMSVLVTTSTFASCIAFHQVAARYLYAMGRERIFPARFGFGMTHPRWKSPWIAGSCQTALTVVLTCFLALVIQQTHADGSVSYALGVAHGSYVPTGGIGTYQWLAIVGTITLILVYLLTNLAAPIYAMRRNELHWFTHILAPLVSSLVLLIPLVALIMPPIPGIGMIFTGLGFSPTPFPLNILPLFVLLWVLLGGVIAFVHVQSPREPPQQMKQTGLQEPGKEA